ncbi:MAG TPA: DUF2357 domain-containing protein [Candidatus Acidoferrales bacterium]|nr:DUF2357 domain-containing protein [Candidatus Acidoferrales bacterium]
MSQTSDRAALRFVDSSGNFVGEVLFIAKKGMVSVLDAPESRVYGEEPLQFVEGGTYEFEVLAAPSNASLREIPNVLSHSRIPGKEGKLGILEPGLYTGRFPLAFESASGQTIARAAIEVRSAKLDYRTEYRNMMNAIAEQCCDLLLEFRAPSQIRLRPDVTLRDLKTIQHRFAFLKSILESKEFQEALRRIVAIPHEKLEKIETMTDIRRGVRPDARSLVQLAAGRRRARLTVSHPLARRMGQLMIREPSVPLRISRSINHQTRDTSENRFVRHTLEVYAEFLSAIEKRLRGSSSPQEQAIYSELVPIRENLLTIIGETFLRDVGPLQILPLGSPVMQRKGGYREILRTWIRFNLAATLDWDGGEEVYGAGKRDLAVLYEYWLFFQLLFLLRRSFGFNNSAVRDLFSLDKDRLLLRLRSGSLLKMESNFRRRGRNLSLRFSYNRTFSPTDDFSFEGAWTRPMRPDFTLSFWPAVLSPEEAERQDIMVHLHFDAKYRAESLLGLFGAEDEDLNEERAQQRCGIYRRSDLLKMHAYRDAIRRTVGAYVLYPGDKTKTWQGFHEILPGIGAFSVRPVATNTAQGIAEVEEFLEKVVNHLCNRASRRERLTFHGYRINRGASPTDVFRPLPELGEADKERVSPPQDTRVMLAPYDNPDCLDWIKSKQRYPIKLHPGATLDSDTFKADFLLVYEKLSGNGSILLQRTSSSAKIESAEGIRALSFPGTIDPSDSYAIFSVEPALGFAGWHWNVTRLGSFTDLAYSVLSLDTALQAAIDPLSSKDSQSDQLVFAFGSNMDPIQMRARCPDSELLAFRAAAVGWKLCFPRESKKRRGGVGSIMRDPGESVWGIVYSVCGNDLKRLDAYEGVPGHYSRELIEVVQESGARESVWTYLAIPQDPPGERQPHKDYIAHYVSAAEHFKLPEEYIESLRSILASAKDN